MERFCAQVPGPKMANMVEQGDTPVLPPKQLQDIGYNGYLSLEYEGDEHNPIPSTLECVQAVRNAIAGL